MAVAAEGVGVVAVMVNGGPVGVAAWPGATGRGVPMVWNGWKKKLDPAGVDWAAGWGEKVEPGVV